MCLNTTLQLSAPVLKVKNMTSIWYLIVAGI